MKPANCGLGPGEAQAMRHEIEQLRKANTSLRKEVGRLTDQLVAYIRTVDQMKIDLIMNGQLRGKLP